MVSKQVNKTTSALTACYNLFIILKSKPGQAELSSINHFFVSEEPPKGSKRAKCVQLYLNYQQKQQNSKKNTAN